MAKGRASRGRQVRAEVGDQRPPQPEVNPDHENSQAQPRALQLKSLPQQQQPPQDDIDDEELLTSIVKAAKPRAEDKDWLVGQLWRNAFHSFGWKMFMLQ